MIFSTLQPGERLRRSEDRDVIRRGDDLIEDAAWLEFIDWAKGYDDPALEGRSRVAHDLWLDQLDRPVLGPPFSSLNLRQLGHAVREANTPMEDSMRSLEPQPGNLWPSAMAKRYFST